MTPDCNKCGNYYITWDKKYPYGCHAMGFKSREIPSLSVRLNSGMDCLKFKPKKALKKHAKVIPV